MPSTANLQDILRTYYAVFDARSAQPANLDAILAPGWKNHSSNGEYADQASFNGLLAGIQKVVPDLTWRIDEVLVAGDRVIVRGEGRGTPVAEFFGVPCTGRSFCLMSMDIHTLQGGRIQRTYHLEDWAGALRQLTSPTQP